jgi:peptidoglycan hydrolase-like protein with peptidoglycan-binding domain
MSPHNDLAAPARWRESLRRSQERRVAAMRRRRRRLRGRTLVIAAIASTSALSGVALAATNGGTGQPATQQQTAQPVAQTLQLGSTGTAVKQIQRKLRVSVTGYYGHQTARAVKRFQRARGLKADGIAGPATLRALGVRVRQASYATGGTTPQSGPSSSTGVPAVLQRIAQCESGGNPTAISRGGRYRGKYQFDQATWERWGGTGDPAAAPESVQDRIAIKLYKARGTAPWPNCA